MIHQHPTRVDKWVEHHQDSLHHASSHPFTRVGGAPRVIYTLSKKGNLDLATIVHHGVFSGFESHEVFCLNQYLYENSPYKRAGVMGHNTRGSHTMVSAGFNYAKSRCGRVWTYWKKDAGASLQLAVWAACKELCGLVGSCLSRCANGLLFQILQDQVDRHYREPLLRQGLTIAAHNPPLLPGMPCNNTQHTCNACVAAHKDQNDMFYTFINWTVKGTVDGDFLIHHLGYGVPIKVSTSLCHASSQSPHLHQHKL